MPFAIAGCGAGGGSGSDIIVPPGNAQFDSFAFTFALDKLAFSRGEPVTGTLTITNLRPTAVTIDFASCDETWLRVQNVGDVSPEGDNGCSGSAHSITLAPQEVNTYRVTWNLKDTQGNTVQPGVYTLTAGFNPSRINGVDVSANRDEYAAPSVMAALR